MAVSACGRAPGAAGTTTTTTTTTTAITTTTTTTTATATANADCPADMALVAGGYCPVVEQRCLQHSEEYTLDEKRREELKQHGVAPPRSRISERCLRYDQPAKCLSRARVPVRFCIDRYEWPNMLGELPALAVTWREAKERCEAAGKRLCDEAEFNFACEGEQLLPYSYGFDRDARRCNIDKPYVTPTVKATPYEDCLKLPACKKQLAALDQRVPAGSLPGCTSPFGVFDLNGNVNEWVNLPGKAAPWRSGLKGGWWGPARSRCRPTVTAHNELYAGYEVGFRCCADPGEKPR